MYHKPQLVGYTRDEVLSGKIRWRDMTPPEYKDLDDKALEEIAAKGVMTPIEKEYIRKDGSRIPILLGAASLPGPTLSGVAFVLDITHRIRTEKALRESEEKFRKFFENEPDYCYMVSPKGRILDINSSALTALGYKKKEIVGKSLIETIYAPSSTEKAKKFLMKWKKKGKLRNEELNIITKAGEERTVLLSVDSVRDADRKLLHSISVHRDITERKQAEEALQKAHDELEEKVVERTKELKEKISELERFYNATLGRELRMKELRDKIEELEIRLREKA